MLGKLQRPRALGARDGGVGLSVGRAIDTRVEHVAEVADAAAEHVEVDAVVLVLLVVVVVVGGHPHRDHHTLSSLGGAGVHKLEGPRDHSRGAVAVAVDGGGTAASRQLLL